MSNILISTDELKRIETILGEASSLIRRAINNHALYTSEKAEYQAVADLLTERAKAIEGHRERAR